MGRKCFVPGCNTGYDSQKKETTERHLSLFKPRNSQQLENWQKVIPRSDKVITSKDTVCELHFNEEDIIRYYEQTVFDGLEFREFKLERGRPLLKRDAIPTVFSSLPSYSSNISKIVKKMKSQQKNDNTYYPLSPIIPKTIKIEEQEIEENLNIQLEESFNFMQEVGQSCVSNNKNEENFTFHELIQNLKWISKPNALWGVTAHETFVMCAKWDENYTLKKRVIIDCDLKVKVYLEDADFSLENADIKSFEEISSLLDYVDGFQL